MELEDTGELSFYQSKIKIMLIIMIGLIFAAFGIVLCVAAFELGDFVMSGIGALTALLCFFAIFVLVRRLLHSKPYLIITQDELIVGASSKNAIPIQREDIRGYHIFHVHFTKTIEVILYDEEKYRDRMSTTSRRFHKVNDLVGARQFGIAWGQVKRKDRRKLLYELDRLSGNDGELMEQFYPQVGTGDKTKKRHDRVNRKYMLRSYGYSLIMTGVASLFFYWGDELDKNSSLLIVSLILFPFAKLIYDVLVGFKLDDWIDKQSFIVIYVYQFKYLIHFFIYLFSFFLAPFGVLYLLVRFLGGFIKKKSKDV